MILKKYNFELEKHWEQIVRNSKNGNFLFSRSYMDYHADRFIDQSVLICKSDKPIAAFPCNESGSTIVSHGGLTYGGLITSVDLHASDVLEIFELIAGHFQVLGKTEIVYKAIPKIFHRYPADEDLYALTRMGATLCRRDLSSAVELAVRPKFSDSRKNTARKCEKSGARVLELHAFNDFHLLLSSVLEKFGAKPVHSLKELELLASRFPGQIRIFGTLLDDQLLAATMIYDFGHVVHTQYMASSEEGRRLGALDFLLIMLIENIFAHKKYLSFGISTEDSGLILNDGLIRQKEGFGGRGVVHDFYRLIL